MHTMPDGIRAVDVDTDRLRMHCLRRGSEDATPVVLVHGNLSTALFWDQFMAAAPAGLQLVAPDMRGFGTTQRAPIDATRGLRDWSDDLAALVRALELDAPVHLIGWSTGGGAIMQYAIDRPADVASLTLVDTVSPYGFGATKDPQGTPTSDDFAGSGGGLANPEFVQRLADGDTSTDSSVSPRSVMRAFYWHPEFAMDPDREDALVTEVLRSAIGDDGYPGDATPSDNWPGVAPGRRGILNALSGRYLNTSGITAIDPMPPILWVHGDGDLVVGDQSMFDAGTLGSIDVLPDWPGLDVHPPQPMNAQISTVLDAYRQAGGVVQEHVVKDSSHGPFIDHLDGCARLIWGFVTSV
ncbi:MAG: alpha/beta fold hydrolase [Actinobacteria bacterium]|nr:alpha/beta fold hydrolase [Actinomycetota bacterium]